jgi:hypothetical protein
VNDDLEGSCGVQIFQHLPRGTEENIEKAQLR